MIVCPACKGWRRHSFDRFCGACGKSFVTLAGRVDPQCSYRGADPLPRTLEVRLENRGAVDPRGAVVVLRDGETGVELHRQQIPEGQLAVEHDLWSYSIDLPARLHASPWRGELVHLLPGPSSAQVLHAVEFGIPMPVLALQEARLGLPAGSAAQPATARLTLLLKDGVSAPVASVEIEPCDGPAPRVAPLGVAGSAGGVRVLPDRPMELTLDLDGELMNGLRRRPGGLPFTLTVTLEGSRLPVRLPFGLFVETPARPEIAVPAKVTALAGRAARIPVTVVNRGGSDCTILELRATIVDGGRTPRVLTQPFRGAAARLAAGETRTVELLLPPDGEGGAPAAGTHRCEIALNMADGTAAPRSRAFVLDLVEPRPFDGIVSIDFGTTASAVAYLRHGDPHPRVVPLTQGNAFIPTSIAYVLDPQAGGLLIQIGDEARRWAEAPNGRLVLYFDNLKWRLTSTETVRLPDGSAKTWIEVAADYLRALRARIEEHPDIAAVVGQVHPSRPARFGSAACAALRLAFRRAGMEPMDIGTGDGGHAMISESWSPLLLALPLPHLAPMQDAAVGTSEMLGPVVTGVHRILTYDVGGGSTDLSLFSIEVKDRANITVCEVATEGTEVLCGNAIGALLFRHLRPSLEDWLERHGQQSDAVPIHLPWDEVPPDGIDAAAGGNGRAVLRLLRALQDGHGGPFLAIIDERAGKTLFAPDDAELLEWARAHQRDVMPELLPDGTPLRLTTVDGEVLEVPWGRDGIELDLPGFLTAFVREMEQPMKALHASALASACKAGEEPPHLVTTGRGGLFPLVSAMTRDHHDKWQAKRSGRVWRVDADYLKNITSLGSVLLADLTGSATGIVFRSDVTTLFGCTGDIDPGTGRQRFLRLSAGYPAPDDGVVAVHRPLPPGDLARRFEFGVAMCEGDVVASRFRREFSVSGRVNLSPEEAATAHILVEARRPHCLTVSIGSAPPGEPVDWKSRRTIELGTVALVAESAAPVPAAALAGDGVEPVMP